MNHETISTTSIAMGLDAIFSAKDMPVTESQERKILQLPVACILPSPFQARKIFSEAAIADLADNIKTHGILQPLMVRKIHGNYYELLAGERRLRAAKSIALSHVPAILFSVDDTTAMAFGLIENIQRQNLNVMEEATAYVRLLNEFQLSHDALSEKIGKSRSHITNIMRLNQLHPTVKEYVMQDIISMGHARAIVSLPAEQHLIAAEYIMQHALSVRQTEEWIKTLDEKNIPPLEISVNSALKEAISEWKNNLSEKLKAEVNITLTASGKARVVLAVNNENALRELIENLMKMDG